MGRCAKAYSYLGIAKLTGRNGTNKGMSVFLQRATEYRQVSCRNPINGRSNSIWILLSVSSACVVVAAGIVPAQSSRVAYSAGIQPVLVVITSSNISISRDSSRARLIMSTPNAEGCRRCRS